MHPRISFGIFLLLPALLAPTCLAHVFHIANNNHTVLDNYKVVLIQFYAEWCHFSRQLMPIFEAASNLFNEETEKGIVAFAQVNCEIITDFCSSHKITKYPTIKVLKYGITSKNEYRGQRTPEAFSSFIKEHLNSSVNIVHSPNQTALEALAQISDTKEAIVGLFSSLDESNQHYQHFLRASHIEKDRCSFHLIYGISDAGDRMAHREALSQRVKEITTMKNADFKSIHDWIIQKCTLPVRELTFANAEEITDEGLPLLLLFYDQKSTHLKQQYNDLIKANLTSFLNQVNFVTADGAVFSHPLSHIGKSSKDLPFFCIDSLVHMYALSKDAKEVLSDAKHLTDFIADLHSGKLHREYHYGPDTPSAPEKVATPAQPSEQTNPPESVFRKLKPSYMKYSIIHDEF